MISLLGSIPMEGILSSQGNFWNSSKFHPCLPSPSFKKFQLKNISLYNVLEESDIAQILATQATSMLQHTFHHHHNITCNPIMMLQNSILCNTFGRSSVSVCENAFGCYSRPLPSPYSSFLRSCKQKWWSQCRPWRKMLCTEPRPSHQIYNKRNPQPGSRSFVSLPIRWCLVKETRNCTRVSNHIFHGGWYQW